MTAQTGLRRSGWLVEVQKPDSERAPDHLGAHMDFQKIKVVSIHC